MEVDLTKYGVICLTALFILYIVWAVRRDLSKYHFCPVESPDNLEDLKKYLSNLKSNIRNGYIHFKLYFKKNDEDIYVCHISLCTKCGFAQRIMDRELLVNQKLTPSEYLLCLCNTSSFMLDYMNKTRRDSGMSAKDVKNFLLKNGFSKVEEIKL